MHTCVCAVDGLLAALTLADNDTALVPCVLLCILFVRYKQTETTLIAKTDDAINSTSIIAYSDTASWKSASVIMMMQITC